jgi:hypothetical protein
MYCKSKLHKLVKCPKATDKQKKDGLTSMRDTIVANRKQAEGRVSKIAAIEMDIENDIEEIGAIAENEFNEFEGDLFDPFQPINTLLECREEEEKREVEPIATISKGECDLVAAWDCGAPTCVAGPRHAAKLATAIEEHNGKMTHYKKKTMPKRYGGVGGGRLTCDTEAKVPISDDLNLIINILDDKVGGDQSVLVGKETMNGAGIVTDWGNDCWFSLLDERTKFTVNGDGSIDIHAFPTPNVKMSNGHSGVNVAELGEIINGIGRNFEPNMSFH